VEDKGLSIHPCYFFLMIVLRSFQKWASLSPRAISVALQYGWRDIKFNELTSQALIRETIKAAQVDARSHLIGFTQTCMLQRAIFRIIHYRNSDLSFEK
jgi:hypothetical protein